MYFGTVLDKSLFILSGMLARPFRGISSIQEIECGGGNLEAEMIIMSLTIFILPANAILAHVSPFKGDCVTFSEFSSCVIDTGDTRRSKLRVLVPDLDEGETRKYGCNCTTLGSFGKTDTFTWSVLVWRNSKSPLSCYVISYCFGQEFFSE